MSSCFTGLPSVFNNNEQRGPFLHRGNTCSGRFEISNFNTPILRVLKGNLVTITTTPRFGQRFETKVCVYESIPSVS